MNGAVLGLRVLLSLACVLGLIWYAQRKLGGGVARRRAAGPALSVVGRQTLGRHTSVAVLAAGDRRLLLGVSDQGVTLLTELDRVEAEDAAEPAAEPAVGVATEALAVPQPLPQPMSAAARLLARLPVQQRQEIDLSSLDTRLDTSLDSPLGHLPSSETPSSERPTDTDVVAISPHLASQVASQAAVRAAAGALEGSILAPSTWRRAASALQHRAARP